MTDELRKLLAAWQATEEAHEQAHSAQDAYIEALVDAAPGLFDAYDSGLAEGERRATAAIVAWARSQAKTALWQEIADAIEKGAHKPLDT